MTEDALLKRIVDSPKLLTLADICKLSPELREKRSVEWLLQGLMDKGHITRLTSPNTTYYMPSLRAIELMRAPQ